MHMHYIYVSMDVTPTIFCSEPGTSANVAPKKRRSKDQSANHIENNQGATGDYLNIRNMPGKASGGKKVATGKTYKDIE